jgi:hypothetical protein
MIAGRRPALAATTALDQRWDGSRIDLAEFAA